MIDIYSELNYIRNYVAIQQSRMEPGTDLKVMKKIGHKLIKR